jgi:hypothetical protein
MPDFSPAAAILIRSRRRRFTCTENIWVLPLLGELNCLAPVPALVAARRTAQLNLADPVLKVA